MTEYVANKLFHNNISMLPNILININAWFCWFLLKVHSDVPTGYPQIKCMVFLEQSERKNTPNIKVLNNLSTRSHL